MKKLSYLLLMVIAITTTSCKKESQDAALLNGTWKVHVLNNKEVSRFNAICVFDIPALAISGSSGCNQFDGKIILDEKKQQIRFDSMSSTLVGCTGELGKFQIDFFDVLTTVDHYHISSKSSLELNNSKGGRIELQK